MKMEAENRKEVKIQQKPEKQDNRTRDEEETGLFTVSDTLHPLFIIPAACEAGNKIKNGTLNHVSSEEESKT